MDYIPFDAILFPADGRVPCIVALQTSPIHGGPASNERIPHPEMHMDHMQEALGTRSWKYQIVRELDGMTKSFASPYIVFYPVISRDGSPFPINRCVREIQRNLWKERSAWRGNVIVGKYREVGASPFATLAHMSMADFPIVKNWLLTHGSPLLL